MSSDVHDDDSAEELAAYYRAVGTELIDTAQKLGVRPSCLTTATLFSSRSGEVAVPEGNKAAVDLLGDHYSLDPGVTSATLYQRTGTTTIEGFEVFLVIRCYMIPDDALPPMETSAEQELTVIPAPARPAEAVQPA